MYMIHKRCNTCSVHILPSSKQVTYYISMYVVAAVCNKWIAVPFKINVHLQHSNTNNLLTIRSANSPLRLSLVRGECVHIRKQVRQYVCAFLLIDDTFKVRIPIKAHISFSVNSISLASTATIAATNIVPPRTHRDCANLPMASKPLTTTVNSDEINYLVFRYLQESGKALFSAFFFSFCISFHDDSVVHNFFVHAC